MAIGDGIGIAVGAALGYISGKVDLLGQRFIEIWSSLPFLYTIIIISSIVVPVYVPGRMQVLQPSFWLLIGILTAFEWMGITYYIRGEFYREKAKDYVGAAIVTGVSEPAIMFRHILPNALTPVISFAPFTIVANIGALVALDFLGFGLPAPTPSWGELIGQGMENLTEVVAGVLPSRRPVSHASARRLHRRSRPGSLRPEGIFQASMTAAEPLLQIRGLRTHFFTESGVAKAVDGVDLDIRPGEVLGLVGESGSGKSVTALSILRLIPDPPGRIVGGEILFRGRDLLKMSWEDIRRVRGKEISMIFQEPMTSLEPSVQDRPAGHGDHPRSTSRPPVRSRRERGPPRCWPRSAFPTRRRGWTSIRTSCRAECGSA